MNTLDLIKEYASLEDAFETPTYLNASIHADVNGYYEAWKSDELSADDIKALRQQIKSIKALIKSYNKLNFTFA